MNTESICMGCLSVDRKLHFLNDEYKPTYYGFLDTLNHNLSVSLCFECLALLQRTIQFKKQVKLAHNYLCTYLGQRSPKSLSSLNLRRTVNFDNLSDTQAEDQNNVILNYKHNDNTSISTINCDVIKNEDICDQKPNQCDQNVNIDQKFNENGVEPLTFIKVEDLEVDLFNDGIHDQVITSAEDSKEQVFSDSDDEPLTVKSAKKKLKTKRNNKNECSGRKRARTEQASGVVTDPRVAKKLRDLNVGSGYIELVMLTWDEVEEERRVALQSEQYTRHTHRCAHCAVGYNHIHKLHEHNKKHSAEAGSEVCDVCSVRCKTRAALASHRRRHRARWVCQRCGMRYSAAGVAADHCARAHAAPRPRHACARCRTTHDSLGALRMHIKSHLSRPECTLCGKTFRDKSSLRTHAFVHRGEKEHACPVCDKRFMFKKQKEIHELTHNQHQHLYCHQCDVSFKNQTSFYQHMKYNLKHIDPADIKHVCGVCGRRFVKAKRLEEHNLAVHLKLAPIKCTLPDCTYACPSRAALRSHVRVTHRGARAPVHVCPRCGHMYKSKKSLDLHLRSHSTAPAPAPAPAPPQTSRVEVPA